MGRTVLIQLLLFLTPFAVYALVLMLTQRDAREPEHWPMRMLSMLAAGGLALMMLGLVVLAQFSGAPPGGTYVPAHMKDGQLVPGQIK